MSVFDHYRQQLDEIKQKGLYRQFPEIRHDEKWIWKAGRKMLNLSSNDYLGLACKRSDFADFLQQLDEQEALLSSSSSRLLTGHFPIYDRLEQALANQFQREAALLFNSGYHANIGILPALADKQTLILADKLVHASLIDGIRLSEARYFRYRHNDYAHLEALLTQHSRDYARVIIVTESVFSMDGDVADIRQLVQLKQRFGNVLLYVDEAHAVGVFGEKGLGWVEQTGCLADVDLIVGTFGKALASMGAYLVCDRVIREFLINQMRPLIFSTALPPLQVAWSYFVFNRLPHYTAERQKLARWSEQLRGQITEITQQPTQSASHILPIMVGQNQHAVALAETLQQQGFYCLPIRPPTVPANTARIRLSLTSALEAHELEHFIDTLAKHYANHLN